MAAYEVKDNRLIAPHRYTESVGAIADHDTPEEELAVNERGTPLEAFRIVGKGAILYQSAEDFNALSDENKEQADELLYVANSRYLKDHSRLGTIEELSASGEQKETEEPKQKAAKSK